MAAAYWSHNYVDYNIQCDACQNFSEINALHISPDCLSPLSIQLYMPVYSDFLLRLNVTYGFSRKMSSANMTFMQSTCIAFGRLCIPGPCHFHDAPPTGSSCR